MEKQPLAELSCLSVEELVTGYLVDRGHNEVAQLCVESQTIAIANQNRDLYSDPQCTLHFIAHYPRPDEPLPDFIVESNKVKINDITYSFTFDETHFGLQDLGRLTIHMPDNVLGSERLEAESGLDHLRQALTERTADIGTIAQAATSLPDVIAVGANQLSSCLKLTLVRNGQKSLYTDRFGHLTEVSVGGEKFRLSVNRWGKKADADDLIILWQSSDAGLGDPILIEDGVKNLRAELE